jgi:hypothetical protein
MFPAQLHADLIASSTRALKSLNEVLANTEKDAQRVSAALGILRLTERIFNKIPLPDRCERRGERPASTPPSRRTRSSPLLAPTDPLTSSPPPLITSSVNHVLTASGHALSRSRPLDPDEVAELNTHYTLQHSRLHDPKLAAFWRNKLEDARDCDRLTSPIRHRAAAAKPTPPP